MAIAVRTPTASTNGRAMNVRVSSSRPQTAANTIPATSIDAQLTNPHQRGPPPRRIARWTGERGDRAAESQRQRDGEQQVHLAVGGSAAAQSGRFAPRRAGAAPPRRGTRRAATHRRAGGVEIRPGRWRQAPRDHPRRGDRRSDRGRRSGAGHRPGSATGGPTPPAARRAPPRPPARSRRRRHSPRPVGAR